MEEERSSTELQTVLRGKAERWRLAGAVTPCQQRRHTFASRAQQERHADLEACLHCFLQPSRQGGKDEAANQATAANGEKDSNVEKKSARTGRACFPGIKGSC